MGVVDRHRTVRDALAADVAAAPGAPTLAADAVLDLPGWCNGRSGALSAAGADALSRLRRDILSARLAPGAPLPLKLLTAAYQAGPMPLREALTLLCGAGLVVPEGARGFRVAPASRADLVDVAQSRRRLETMALALSIRRGDALWRRQVGRTRRALAEVAAQAENGAAVHDDWDERHRRYHFALIAACGSAALLGFCAQLHDRFDRYRRLAPPSKSSMAGVDGDHDTIADAALAGAVAHAVALLDRHIAETGALVLGNYAAHAG
jgi:GntR family carbon starvation induced transcriptional regulator